MLPRLLVTTAVAVAVAAPWHLSMVMLHGHNFVQQYLGREVLERATGANLPGHDHPEPVWFYLGVIVTRYWPWLIPLVAGCVALARGRLGSRSIDVARLGLVWSAGWLVALSAFPDRRDRYDIPVYMGTAIIAGVWLASTHGRLRRLIRALIARVPPAILVAIAILTVLPLEPNPPEAQHWRDFRAWYAAAGPQEIWNGSCGASQTARVYLITGAWARLAFDPASGNQEPPEGALILYHSIGERSPGPNESEVFRSGDLRLTRLGPGGWHPVPAPS
jgi:4-amino-4-deoxy-L-arabinose transferase-like glycosyltransferase